MVFVVSESSLNKNPVLVPRKRRHAPSASPIRSFRFFFMWRCCNNNNCTGRERGNRKNKENGGNRWNL